MHGRDKQKDSITVHTGDKYYDSGGPGGARFADQPGNYKDCTDPISETINCSAVYTFCSSNGDTVALNFVDYLIVTGDALRIYSGNNTKGSLLFNSKDQGVSINGMKLTTGTLIKSHSANGCLTVEMFASTIGNALGWEADFILFNKKNIANSCAPVCTENVTVVLPTDTCYSKVNVNQFTPNPNVKCALSLTLYYPPNTDDLANVAVNMSHAGKRFLFQISDSSGGACVGYVKVNESQVPMPDCTIDTISCLGWENLHSPILKFKSCNGKGFRVTNQKFNPYDCESNIIGFITRNLEVFADTGIIASCIDTVYIQKISIDSLQKPGDINFKCEALSVNAAFITPQYLLTTYDLNHDYLVDGTTQRIIPLVNNSPFPDSSSFCSFSIRFNDLVIPGCGKSYKIRRQWMLESACEKKDSIFIQYIIVSDDKAPELKPIEARSYTISRNNCLAKIFLDSITGISDCDIISQKIELSYKDPINPGNQIVINDKLPITISLPKGSFNVKYTFTDPCFNVTQQSQCLWVTDNSEIEFEEDTIMSKFVDPGSCTARVYAKDFEKLISNSCDKKYLISIALQDSVSYYQKYWEDKLKTSCSGVDNWLSNSSRYQALIDRWISTYIFNDYVDLGSCQENKVVIKISKIDFLPAVHSTFLCSESKWSAYISDSLYRSHINANKSCTVRYNLNCLTEIKKDLAADKIKYLFPNLAGFNESSCQTSFFQLESNNSIITEKTVSIKIKVSDTLVPIIPLLPDIEFYENQNSQVGCCGTGKCKGDVYSANNWPKSFTCAECDSNNFSRYFGGPLNSEVSYDAQGYFNYTSCMVYDTLSYFRPIYCRSILSNNTVLQYSKDSLFTQVFINKVNAPITAINFKLNCTSSWQLTSRDTTLHSNTCAQDTLVRIWNISNPCNANRSFSQRLIVKKRSDFEVLFPTDVFIDCSAKLIKDSSELKKLFGYPVVRSTASSCISISYKDSLISESKGDYCLLTQRLWKIEDPSHRDLSASNIEWIINDSMVANLQNRFCAYRNLKDGGDGIMYYKQIITYIDKVKPVISILDTIINGSKCTGPAFDLKFKVYDDCTPEEVLFTYHRLDLQSDGIFENNYSRIKDSLHFNDGLPAGVHSLMSTCTDLCGNIDTVISKITITDDGLPLALCVQSSVLVPIPASRTIDILAKDFDAGSLAGCDNGSLRFSFSNNVFDSLRTFTCDSIGDKALIVYITNSSAKQSFCQIKLQVTSDSSCLDVLDNISINGNIMNVGKSGIKNVEIKTNALFMKAMTDDKGIYSLSSLSPGQNITLIPAKNDDPLNGLSTIDLLLIERHIKGLSTITDPYLLIAADINRSGSITITDLVELRRMILGSITSFSNNKNWLFVPQSYKFNDPISPWIFPETISYNPISNSLSDVNFIGIKVGDVNNSATINASILEKRNFNERKIEIKESVLNGNYNYEVILKNSIPQIQSFQMFFNLDKRLNNVNVISQIMGNGDLHYHYKNGKLNIVSSNPVQIQVPKSQNLFTIVSKSKIQDLDLNPDNSSFLFDGESEYQITIYKSPVIYNDTRLQIYPNPSTDLVQIRYYINDLQTEFISLTNIHGKKLNYLLPKPKLGWNHILLTKNDLYGLGQYFFSVNSSGRIKTSSFIIL